MAISKETFDGYLAKILSARYGEEVRGSIHDSLQGMYEIVQQNIIDVSTAKNMLDTVDSLNQIKTEATNAANAANQAAANLDHLKTEASNAASSANAAASAANKASSNATEAFKKASEAVAAANNAVLAAQSATSDANAAASRTNTAISKANEAANSVNEAKQAALNAANSVEEAKTAAMNAANSVEEAKTAATEAASRANTAASNADTATSKANTAASNADTATSKANTAASNADEATSKANTAASNADEATSKANEAANSVEEAKTAATEAASRANTAASNADTATSKANTAASNADTATSKANTAASNADEATSNAAQAADRANNAAQIVEDLQIGDLDIGSIATKEYIDGIEIGGTNLLKGTRDFSGASWVNMNNMMVEPETFGGLTVIRKSDDRLPYGWNYPAQNVNIEIGGDYTFSAYVKAETPINCIFYLNDVSGEDDNVTIQVTTEWKKYSITKNRKAGATLNCSVQCEYGDVKVYLCGFKLERGNKATDWSPNPEDFDAKIDGIEIGGRNLLLGTADLTTARKYFYSSTNELSLTEDGVKNIYSGAGTNEGIIVPLAYDGILDSTITSKFVLSFDCRGTINNLGSFYWIKKDYQNIYIDLSNTIFDLSETEWTHVEASFESGSANKKNVTEAFICMDPKGVKQGDWIEIKKKSLMLEYGNKPTDWSPAPEDVDAKIDSIPRRNLILNSNVRVSNKNYNVATYKLSEPFMLHKLYKVTIWGKLGENKTGFELYIGTGSSKPLVLNRASDETYVGYWCIDEWYPGRESFDLTKLFVFATPDTETNAETVIEKIKMEYVGVLPDWNPAPEDVNFAISRRSAVTYDYGGRNLKEIFGTAEALHNVLAAEDYSNIAVGDYWPVTINGTFWDYGSYTTQPDMQAYKEPDDSGQAWTNASLYEAAYYNDEFATYRSSDGTTFYMRISDCLPYFERACNNIVVKLEIGGINQYWRYGDTGALTGNLPHLPFISRDCLPFSFCMRKGNTKWEDESATNPWVGSALYKTLNDPDHGLIHLLMQTELGPYIYAGPNDKGMRALMEAKAPGVENATGWEWCDRGKLFLPSVSEVWGHPFWADVNWEGGLGNQFAIFRDSRRHISKGNGDGGSRGYWWTCSTYAGNAAAFVFVSYNGSSATDGAANEFLVPLCFVFA